MTKLTSLAARRQNQPGKYRDTNGVILQITKTVSSSVEKLWFAWSSHLGKQREANLISSPDLSLASAHIEAAK